MKNLPSRSTAIADLEMLVGVEASYFELLTAAAFRWFDDIAIDVAVIEVGLLGRWDATNVIDADVAVITNIALDHTEYAGPTLADIAREKAGIIKPNCAVVIGETDPDLLEVLRAEPAATGFERHEHFDVVESHLAVGGRMFDLRTVTTSLPRGVSTAARPPPGRQRSAGADGRRGILRCPVGQ